jgi:alanyl-tRNA synthetase
MGLERMAQILHKISNNYETDLIFPLIKAAALLAQIKYETTNKKK